MPSTAHSSHLYILIFSLLDLTKSINRSVHRFGCRTLAHQINSHTAASLGESKIKSELTALEPVSKNC